MRTIFHSITQFFKISVLGVFSNLDFMYDQYIVRSLTGWVSRKLSTSHGRLLSDHATVLGKCKNGPERENRGKKTHFKPHVKCPKPVGTK